MAGMNEQWRKFRQHATIENNPEMLLRLATELDERKRQRQSERRIE